MYSHLTSPHSHETESNLGLNSLMPNVSKVISIKKRLLRPQTYRGVAAAAMDVPKWKKINNHLQSYTERSGKFFFIQIGANDGEHVDPINSHIKSGKWEGILVEPVPHLFKKLQENYSGVNGLEFVNAAITDQDGSAEMMVAMELEDGSKNPMDALSSFHPEVANKHSWMVDGQINNFMQPQQVRTMQLSSLMVEHNVEHVDGLFIDTEGHDKIVLDQIDFADLAPSFIMYEHAHLSSGDQSSALSRLNDFGYSTTSLRRDTFAELTQ